MEETQSSDARFLSWPPLRLTLPACAVRRPQPQRKQSRAEPEPETSISRKR
jgi:hypothetical protein